jgi:hypothetical protein
MLVPGADETAQVTPDVVARHALLGYASSSHGDVVTVPHRKH